MFVYLRIELMDGCNSYTAYYTIEDHPSYIWRYANYYDGLNYFRTYMNREMLRPGSGSLMIGIL